MHGLAPIRDPSGSGHNIKYCLLLLAALGGWVLVEYRQRLGFALRTGLAWGMIFVGVAAGYGLWGDIRRDIRPSQTVGTPADRVTLSSLMSAARVAPSPILLPGNTSLAPVIGQE